MPGLILWMLQLLTALYLLAGLYLHLFSAPLTGKLVFDSLFIFCAVAHGLNGLWGIIDESLRGKWWRVPFNLFTDFIHNIQAGHFMFILHRVTGLIILLFLTQHIITNSLVSFYLSIEDSIIIEFLRNDMFAYIAVVSLGFHAFNGIRIIFIELTSLTWLQKKTAYLSLFSGAIFAMYYIL